MRRARLKARERVSPIRVALAELVRPNQGERLRPRRVWDALRDFGIALATDAQLPGGRAYLEITGQADTAIREAQANGEAVAQGMLWGRHSGRLGEEARYAG